MDEWKEREIVEILRSVKSFRNKQRIFFSKGYINSDGKKALIPIIKRCVRVKPALKKYLYEKFKEGSLERILQLLDYIEENLERELQSNERR